MRTRLTVGISPLAALTVSRRAQSTMEMLTLDKHLADAYQVLGLDGDGIVTDADVGRAFKQQLKLLSRKDGAAKLPHRQFHHPKAKRQVPGVDIGRDESTDDLARLVRAYKMLRRGSAVRAQYRDYTSQLIDAKLGTLRDDSPFSNYNAQHTTFVFGDAESVRPIGDSTRAYREAHGWDHTLRPLAPDDPGEPGSDIHFHVKVRFDEALNGCEKTLDYMRFDRCKVCDGTGGGRKERRTCTSCHGRGQHELPSGTYLVRRECSNCDGRGTVRPPPCSRCDGTGVRSVEEQVTLSIEPGAAHGSKIRLARAGHAGTRGQRFGDVVATLLVSQHRLFHRIGADLHIALPVPLSTALLGGYIDAPTLDGPRQVEVPPGVTSGSVVTVGGLGLPDTSVPGLRQRGSLRVHLIVVVPNGEKLPGAQRNCIERLNDDDVAPFPRDGTPLELDPAAIADAKRHYAGWLPTDGVSSATSD